MVTKTLKKLISVICALSLIITGVPALAESDASLKSLWVSGSAVIDFDPNVYEYDLLVPYKQDTNGDWKLVFPEVHAMPTDSQATVTIEELDDCIEVYVESADETNSQTYTLNIDGIGENLYVNGGFEGNISMAAGGQSYDYSRAKGTIINAGSGVTLWNIDNGVFTIAEDEVFSGNDALRIDTFTSSTAWYGALNTTGKTLTDGNTYITAVTGKLSESASQSSYDTTHRIQYDSAAPAGIIYYDSEGTASEKNKVTFTKQWKTFSSVFDTTGLGNKIVKNNFTQWSANHPSIVLDNFYVGKLVISDIAIVDEEGIPVQNIAYPEDGVSELQLSAKALNQHGHNGGLENEAVSQWRLIGEPEGVTISDTGLLTVEGDAEKNSVVYVEVIMQPSYSGALQQKAKGIAAIKISDISASELSGIKINGKSIPGFESKKKSYSVDIPYMYKLEDDSVSLPVIEAIPNSEDATVDIHYPDSVDGETVEITVTSADDVTSVYYIEMNVIGQNLLENGGFEDGTTGWTSSLCTITETTENPGAGNKALLITNSQASKSWYPDLTLEAGKAYIVTSMARLQSEGTTYESTWYFSSFKGKQQHYNMDGTSKSNGNINLTGNWQQTMAVLKNTNEAYKFKSIYTRWGSNEPDMVVDSYYVGELVVSDISYTGENKIVIPTTADEKVSLKLSATMLNQFGNTAGLEDEPLRWTLQEDYPGVSISENKLIVDGHAYAQTIKVLGELAPSFVTDQKVQIEVEIELEAANPETLVPRADDVYITGSVVEGSDIQANYYYYHTLNENEGASVLQWYKGSSLKGPFTPIEGETGLILEDISAALADSYIRFSVTPVTESGVAGKTVYSNVLLKPTAPIANNVTVSGISAIDQILTGSYVFYDENGDSEVTPSFCWEIADAANGTFETIDNEETNTYKIREGDIGKYVRFGVKPKSAVGPDGEKFFYSSPMPCADNPYVYDVKINKVSDGVYSVSYVYGHPLMIEEGQSIVEWTVDGQSAGSNTSVTVSTTSSHTISVTVTPYAALPPYTGEAVTETLNIDGPKHTDVGTVKGPSGGGGGGSSPSTLVPVPETKPEEKDEPVITPPVNNNPQPPTQERYWASDGIDFVLSNKIMKTKEDGSFAGTETVCRAEFISYVMQVLGEEEAVYTGMFSDVPKDACYGGNLQRAVDMGIISVDTAFYPMRSISRQEICKILVLAMGIENNNGADLNIFKDKNSIGQWALGYVAQAVNAKILNGVAADEFLPLGNVTREQTAVILKRLFDFKIGGTVK